MSTSSELPNFAKVWDFSDPEGTEKLFRQILPAAEATGDQSYCGQLLTQIARAEGLQEKFTEAHATLDSVGSRLRELPTIVQMRYLLERGRVFSSSDNPDQARPLFEQAWELGQQEGEHGLPRTLARQLAGEAGARSYRPPEATWQD